jgi:PEP-CTERM motif
MSRILKRGALLAIVTVFSALPAKPDSGATLDYTLSAGPVTASWTMSQDLTAFLEDGTASAVNSTDLIVDGLPVDDIICFCNLNDLGGVSIVTYLSDLVGAQLYTVPEDSPTMLTGLFYFTDELIGDAYTLNVTQVPEPMTWLLLASGLAALALKRKKLLAN